MKRGEATMVTQPFDAYRKIKALNWTHLKRMRQSAKHFKYWSEHETEDTPTMILGRAVHTAVLEPDRFPIDYAVWKGARRAGNDWEAFQAANADRTILRLEEYQWCLEIRDAVRAHPVAKHLLEVGEAEKTIVWTDEASGLKCKGRLDFLNGIGLVDLKTTADLDPIRFGGQAARLGYHCQLAFYRRGLRANGIDVPVKILACEKDPPHDVAVLALDDDTLFAADEEVSLLLKRVVECRKSKQWPGRFGNVEAPLQLPGWAFGNFPDDPALGLIVGGEEV
jgi:hypothetical protein